LTGGEKELITINHVEAREPHVGSRSEHARFHVIVEDQIAMGEETPASATLDRLMVEGLSRHESIHAIASIIMEEVLASMNEGIKRTEEDYFESLGNLTAARWFADYGQDADAGSFATPAAILQKSAAKVSHNDPCPCGSGKKYKRCCLRFAN
jgi:preprotein translocase subunit SecA